MRLTTCKHHLLGAALIAAGSAAIAIPSQYVTDSRDPARQAAFCAAFLTNDVRPAQNVDRRRRSAALNAWRVELRRLRPSDAGNYLSSALDSVDNESLDSRMGAATYCESRAPRHGRRR
jgi:hypothetical protein